MTLKDGVQITQESKNDLLEIRIAGAFDRLAAADVARVIREAPDPPPPRVALVLGAGRIGSVGAVLLDRLCASFEKAGSTVSILPADESQRRALSAHGAAPAETARAQKGGRRDGGDGFFRSLLLLREILARGVFGFLYPGRSRAALVLAAVVETGARALPLTIVINFLIGAVLALQAGPFFAKFGQELLVAQLVAMAQLREIGPLLTAILVAGRTASSLAAEIGAMKSGEEIDALRVVGSSPVDVLVVPRWRALVIALPILALFADAAGVAGGLVVGVSALDISASAWWEQTLRASRMQDVVGGLVKSAAFATALVAVAAHQGFAASGGAAGVGRRTTRAVVFGITAVILIDAFFTLVFYGMEL